MPVVREMPGQDRTRSTPSSVPPSAGGEAYPQAAGGRKRSAAGRRRYHSCWQPQAAVGGQRRPRSEACGCCLRRSRSASVCGRRRPSQPAGCWPLSAAGGGSGRQRRSSAVAARLAAVRCHDRPSTAWALAVTGQHPAEMAPKT